MKDEFRLATVTDFSDSLYLAYLRMAVKTPREGSWADQAGGLGGLGYGALKAVLECLPTGSVRVSGSIWDNKEKILTAFHAQKDSAKRAGATLDQASYEGGVDLAPEFLDGRQTEYALDWILTAAFVGHLLDRMPKGNTVEEELSKAIEQEVDRHNGQVRLWAEAANGVALVRPLLLLMEKREIISPNMRLVGLDYRGRSDVRLVLQKYAEKKLNV